MRKGHPDVHASGDDGDENAKAALYALKELDGSEPTVAFFITDAGYHRTKWESHTAQAEDDYLLEKGAHVTDFYVLFDSVRGKGFSSLLSETLQRTVYAKIKRLVSPCVMPGRGEDRLYIYI